MKLVIRIVAITAVLAMSIAPAFAKGPPAGSPGASHQPTTNPGSAHRLAAPGQYCKAESKKHVAGTPGTPFSACVKAQAKLRTGATNSPREACKAESKKHIAGAKGTPFSRCVSAGAKLVKDEKAQDDDEAPAATSTPEPTETPTP